jgi:cell division protein FtsB
MGKTVGLGAEPDKNKKYALDAAVLKKKCGALTEKNKALTARVKELEAHIAELEADDKNDGKEDGEDDKGLVFIRGDK